MVTLAFAQMLYSVFHDTKLGGGSDGIYIYIRPELTIAGIKPLDLENPVQFYYFVLAVLIGVYGLLSKVLHAPFGRALAGIKANESRMRSLGYPVFAYKLGAFVLAGALAGLAGYLAACQFGFVNPEILAWHQSGTVLMMVILGGMGKLQGAVLGAFGGGGELHGLAGREVVPAVEREAQEAQQRGQRRGEDDQDLRPRASHRPHS